MDWNTFDDVIKYLDETIVCYTTIKKQYKKIVKCEKCCPRKKLVSIKLYNINFGMATTVTLEITIRESFEETTLKYDKFSLILLTMLQSIWEGDSGSGDSSTFGCEV